MVVENLKTLRLLVSNQKNNWNKEIIENDGKTTTYHHRKSKKSQPFSPDDFFWGELKILLSQVFSRDQALECHKACSQNRYLRGNSGQQEMFWPRRPGHACQWSLTPSFKTAAPTNLPNLGSASTYLICFWQLGCLFFTVYWVYCVTVYGALSCSCIFHCK